MSSESVARVRAFIEESLRPWRDAGGHVSESAGVYGLSCTTADGDVRVVLMLRLSGDGRVEHRKFPAEDPAWYAGSWRDELDRVVRALGVKS